MKLSEVSFKMIIGSLFVMSCFTGFSKDYRVDAKSSKLEWVAKKVTGQHTGTISFGESVLNVEKKKITGGHYCPVISQTISID